ncbi:MAG: DUF6088 family protein [Flavobacterium sp.]|nr:DUF6088 family protein [Flavobacterium sp.]
MERPIVENKIFESLKSRQKGVVIFVSDFSDYGSAESVKKALLRLNEKETIVRLAHGIYLYPKVDKELGILFPSTEDIALAIARRDKVRIIPTGVQALNKLGLSTQVPMKLVYLTDGGTRNIKVGKRTISFKNTSPKNLFMKGEISSMVIQALKTIGNSQLDDSTLLKIQNILKKEKKDNIINDAKLAPVWISKILTQTI